MLSDLDIYSNAIDNFFTAMKMRYTIKPDCGDPVKYKQEILSTISSNNIFASYFGDDIFNHYVFLIVLPMSITSYTQSKLDQDLKKAIKAAKVTSKNIHTIVIGNLKDRKSIFKSSNITHADIYFNEYIRVKQLSINIMDHFMQPKFRVITNTDEIKEVLLKYNAVCDQLATMNFDDPVNFYLGAVPKFSEKKKEYYDLVEIQRTDGLFYRKITWNLK